MLHLNIERPNSKTHKEFYNTGISIADSVARGLYFYVSFSIK